MTSCRQREVLDVDIRNRINGLSSQQLSRPKLERIQTTMSDRQIRRVVHADDALEFGQLDRFPRLVFVLLLDELRLLLRCQLSVL